MAEQDTAAGARRPRLTADRVLDGAMALAGRIGVDDLTIRRLAEALGTRPMTIYHHLLPSKVAILDGWSSGSSRRSTAHRSTWAGRPPSATAACRRGRC